MQPGNPGQANESSGGKKNDSHNSRIEERDSREDNNSSDHRVRER